jgi:hypothetical protein
VNPQVLAAWGFACFSRLIKGTQMNLVEIKNADKWELYEYVKDMGYDVYPTSTKKRLRDCALDLYWRMKENSGYNFDEETTHGAH